MALGPVLVWAFTAADARRAFAGPSGPSSPLADRCVIESVCWVRIAADGDGPGMPLADVVDCRRDTRTRTSVTGLSVGSVSWERLFVWHLPRVN